MQLKLIGKEFVFGEGTPFASCHASTLVVLDSGEIVASWFGGSEEGADDVAIWVSRREADGSRWSAPELVAGGAGIPHWNPVLHSPDGKRAVLYYKEGKTIPAWRTLVRESADGGRTWSAIRELVSGDVGGRGPVKNKPIVASDGALLAPASVEARYWDAFVDRSEDGGATWKASNLVAFPHDESYEGTGLIQPTLWESPAGSIHMLIRSRTGRIWRSDSADGGRTWGPGYPTYLPNNSSGIDLDRAADGTLVLAYNPVGMPKGPRTPLVLGVSSDDGENWKQGAIVENEPGEFSYPALVIRGTGIHLAYTWNRTRIAYCRYAIEA